MAFFGSIACGIGALLALDGETRRGDVIATALAHRGSPVLRPRSPVRGRWPSVDIALTRERFRRAFVVVVPTALWLLWYLRLGPRRGDLRLLSQLPDLARIRERRSRVESLEPARPRGPTRRDVGERARLGPAPAGDRARLRGLADRPGGARGNAEASVGRGCRAARVLVPDRPQRVVLRPGDLGSLPAPRCGVLGDDRRRAAARGGDPPAGSSPWSSPSRCWRRSPTSRCCDQTAGGLAGIAEKQRGGLAALELARAEVDPAFLLTEENSGVDYLGILDAGSYFSAIDAYGSPAYTADELAGASDRARMSADKVSAAALGIGLEPVPASTTRACAPAPSPGSEPIPVPPGGTVIRARSEPVPGQPAPLRRSRVPGPPGHGRRRRRGGAGDPRGRLLANPGGSSSTAPGRPWSARWGRERERRRRGRIGAAPPAACSATRDSRSPCSRSRPSSRRAADRAQYAADLLHRRLGGAPASPRASAWTPSSRRTPGTRR